MIQLTKNREIVFSFGCCTCFFDVTVLCLMVYIHQVKAHGGMYFAYTKHFSFYWICCASNNKISGHLKSGYFDSAESFHLPYTENVYISTSRVVILVVVDCLHVSFHFIFSFFLFFVYVCWFIYWLYRINGITNQMVLTISTVLRTILRIDHTKFLIAVVPNMNRKIWKRKTKKEKKVQTKWTEKKKEKIFGNEKSINNFCIWDLFSFSLSASFYHLLIACCLATKKSVCKNNQIKGSENKEIKTYNINILYLYCRKYLPRFKIFKWILYAEHAKKKKHN